MTVDLSVCRILTRPWFLVSLMTAGLALSMTGASPAPDRDFFFYQRFIEMLATGRLDLTIPGFHGSDLLAVPWYLFSRSPIAEIEFQMVAALLVPLSAYLAGRSFFRGKWEGIALAGIFTMMPFYSLIGLTGYTAAAYTVLMLLTVAGACRKAFWTWVTWGLAMTTKPFAVALLPILLLKQPQAQAWIKRYGVIILGLLIPLVYAAIQYFQAGRLIVGVHPELDESTVWQGPVKVLLNIAYALQILFSVHNYDYPNPAGTGHENLLQTTPILVFLGLFALLYPREYFPDRRTYLALLAGVVIGLGMNAFIATMNHYYMQAGVLVLIFASIPVLKRHPLWAPFVLATLHFQWFYFALQFAQRMDITWLFFAAPAVVDALFFVWVLMHYQSILHQIGLTLRGVKAGNW